MVKDLSGAVHLTQDDDHLVVDVLLKLPQVTSHVHLQLCADLRGQGRKGLAQVCVCVCVCLHAISVSKDVYGIIVQS